MTSEKKDTFVPDSVTSVPNGQDQLATDVEYAAMILRLLEDLAPLGAKSDL
jgi:hypothetical protein